MFLSKFLVRKGTLISTDFSSQKHRSPLVIDFLLYQLSSNKDVLIKLFLIPSILSLKRLNKSNLLKPSSIIFSSKILISSLGKDKTLIRNKILHDYQYMLEY